MRLWELQLLNQKEGDPEPTRQKYPCVKNIFGTDNRLPGQDNFFILFLTIFFIITSIY